MSTDPELAALAARQHGVVAARQLELGKSAITRRVQAGRLHVVHRGIPVTSTARMLVDVSHLLGDDELPRMIRELQFRRLFDRRAVEDALTRRPSSLRAHLPMPVTDSALEDRFLRICSRQGLPEPRRQYRIGARRYDFAWPEQRVVVETDGWQAHGGAYAFQADRSASNALQLGGWTILRFTWTDLTRRPREVAAAVRDALAL